MFWHPLMSGYLMESIGDNKDFQGAVRNVQKGPKTAKWVIFKGDGSLDLLFSRLSERLRLFWTSHMSGYLMEPIRDDEDFKEAARNVKTAK